MPLQSKKFLILGGGAVVREFYLPALHLLDLLSNALVVDNSLSVIKSLTKMVLGLRCERMDFRDYLKGYPKKDNFDAAIVALPNYLHAEAVELGLSKELPVLCEKPLAMSESKCLRLGRLSEDTGKVLAVGMVRRLLPSVSALREALRNGLIGSLESIDIEMGPYVWSTESGSSFQVDNGGILMDMGVHYLDLVQSLIGEFIPISYQDDCKGGVEANVEFILHSAGGVSVKLILSRTHTLRNTAIFKGESGELILEKDTFDCCLWRSYRMSNLISRLYPRRPFQESSWPANNLVSCFAEQLLNFIDAIDGKTSWVVTANQAAKIMHLIEWAYNQRQEKRIQIESPRPVLSPAKVVVTGGTGFIGGHLVERLVDLGSLDITVPVRNYKTCARVACFPVKMPKVNLLDYKQLKTAIQGSRFVFHLAYGRDGLGSSRVTIKGTQNVVNASIECKVECVVVLSTMYVFGFPDTEELIDESWPYNPTGGEYGRSKAKMERWCLRRAKTQGSTRIVVLNPPCVYGPWGNTYTQLPIKLAGEGSFCWIEEGRGIANYTFIDNLIDAIILAATCKKAQGERFIINDGFCSWREFLTPLLGEFAKSLPSFRKKELVMQNRIRKSNLKELISHLANDTELVDIINRMSVFGTVKRKLLKSSPKLHSILLDLQSQASMQFINTVKPLPSPPEWLADLFGPTKTRFSAEKAKKVLGWRPFISLTEGQKITRIWLKSIGLL